MAVLLKPVSGYLDITWVTLAERIAGLENFKILFSERIIQNMGDWFTRIIQVGVTPEHITCRVND